MLRGRLDCRRVAQDRGLYEVRDTAFFVDSYVRKESLYKGRVVELAINCY